MHISPRRQQQRHHLSAAILRCQYQRRTSVLSMNDVVIKKGFIEITDKR
jgi:hypothetical protein